MEENYRKPRPSPDAVDHIGSSVTPWITSSLCLAFGMVSGNYSLAGWCAFFFVLWHLVAKLILWSEKRKEAVAEEWVERTSCDADTLPCKHCRGDSEMVFVEDANLFFARCAACHLSAGFAWSVDEAVEEWNDIMRGVYGKKERDIEDD